MSTYHFIPTTIEGSAERGGWAASGSVFNDQEDVEYGRQSIISFLPEGGGDWFENSKIAVDGSFIPQSLNFDRGSSELPLTVNTSDVFLQNGGLQGIYFSEQAVPLHLHQMTDLNLGKIVEHVVEEHTNISTDIPGGWVDTTGIDTVNSTPANVFTVKASNSIWQSIQSIASNEFYVRYFTKRDKLIYEPHPQYLTVLNTPVMVIDERYLLTRPEITFRERTKIDQVQLYALTDDGAILQSFYPTDVGTEGKREKIANLRCNSQARLDVLSERRFKFLNRDIDVLISIPGPWGLLFELYDRVSITYQGTSRNGVTIDWSEKKFYIETVTVNRVSNFSAASDLFLTEEVL